MDEGDGQVQSVVLQVVFWIGTGKRDLDLELNSYKFKHFEEQMD